MTTLRCGLIGFGMMGKNHARVLKEVVGVELVVIADQLLAQGSELNGVPVVRDVSSALKYELDCAVVAVPTAQHENVAIQMAEAGVPSLVEKPLADSVESAERIVRAFAQSKTFGAVGHIERFNPALQELKKRITAGDLGEIFQIATRRQSSFPGRISDVGVVKDLATHDIDTVFSLTGSDYSKVSALTAHKSGRPNEDMLIATAQLANGVIVSHLVNWLSPLKERVTVVTGEVGIFIADTLRSDLTLYRNGQFDMDWESLSTFRGVSEGDMTRFAFDRKEPLKAEIEAFVACVAGGDNENLTDLPSGLRVLAVAEKMLSSSGAAN